MEHDCPDWLADWLAQAAAPPEQFAPHSPAVELLGNIHKLTPEAAQVLLAVLPSVTPPVQGYLLASLSWLVRRDAWPEDLRPALLERLWSWLQDESDPNRRGQLLEVLGHWRWERPALAQHLLAGFHPTEEEEWVAYDMALARLAQWEPSLAKEIQFLLELALETQPQAAAPALARLLVFQNAREQTAEQLLDDLLNRLPKPPACLDALLEAGADDDIWNDRYHAFLSTAARQWIAGQAEESAAILLGQLGKRLRCVLSGDWPERRICLAVTTACAEALPSALQKACPDDLEALLVQGAVDPYCYDSRRFALTALSYLRTVTPAVIPALLAGCQDIAIVQRDAITAAGRFQYIEGDLLPELLPVLRGHSVSTAYAVAKLLASLSTSPGATSDLRQRIVAGLAEAIQDRESSQREVLLETQSSWSNEIKLESKGKLEETLYEALLQAAGWPV